MYNAKAVHWMVEGVPNILTLSSQVVRVDSSYSFLVDLAEGAALVAAACERAHRTKLMSKAFAGGCRSSPLYRSGAKRAFLSYPTFATCLGGHGAPAGRGSGLASGGRDAASLHPAQKRKDRA